MIGLKPPLQARGPLLNLYQPKAGDGCVLWLPGQDDAYSATIRDRSGYGNHGTIYGATWVRNSKGLWVLSFDGTGDRVTLASPLADWNADFTIEMWVSLSSLAGAGQMGFASNRMGAGQANWVTLGWETTSIAIEAGPGGHGAYSGVDPRGLGYYHYALVLSSHLLTLYVNAISKCTLDVTTDLLGGATNTLVFGAWAFGTADLIGGEGLQKLFNGAATLAQITSRYQQERHLFGV